MLCAHRKCRYLRVSTNTFHNVNGYVDVESEGRVVHEKNVGMHACRTTCCSQHKYYSKFFVTPTKNVISLVKGFSTISLKTAGKFFSSTIVG